MKNLLYKELKLSTPLLTYLFLGFAFMTFLPGYPILCGTFFVCLGIFQSYQFGREDNDILYTVLLPIKKADAVKLKYFTALIIESAAFLITSVSTLIRMMFLSEAKIYTNNALMGANLIFLAFVLVIFTLFNVIFIGGFFKTAYGIGKPFIIFSALNFITIGFAESLHHLPGLGWTNTLDFNFIEKQIPVLFAAIIIYFGITFLSCNLSQKRFEKTDI